MSKLHRVLTGALILAAGMGAIGCGGSSSPEQKQSNEIDSSPEAAEMRSQKLLNQDPNSIVVNGDNVNENPPSQGN